jgi:hypothetical protein
MKVLKIKSAKNVETFALHALTILPVINAKKKIHFLTKKKMIVCVNKITKYL